ncbi:hypothetical protein HN011_001184 [Eciton burchellii]|nr:hypothetical protein HN011_001184 [Eciton burchellii]
MDDRVFNANKLEIPSDRGTPESLWTHVKNTATLRYATDHQLIEDSRDESTWQTFNIRLRRAAGTCCLLSLIENRRRTHRSTNLAFATGLNEDSLTESCSVESSSS